jgi:hypothetical protein
MTSTRDPEEPTAVTADAAATDDTAGFTGINTTRANIKSSSAVVVPPIGLGGGLVPSLGLPSLGESDVTGFVATGAPASEQPADGTADSDDTAGFGVINTTRSNIPRHAVHLGGIPPLGLGGLPTPSFEPPALAGDDVAGFVAAGPVAGEQPAEDTAGFSDPIPGVDVKLGRNPGGPRASVNPFGPGGGLTAAFAAPAGSDVIGFGATNPAASDLPADDTAGFGLGLLGGPLLPSPVTAPPPGNPGGPLINRPPNPLA